MKKKPHTSRVFKPKLKSSTADRTWHNGGDVESAFYARPLHKAAKRLIEAVNPEPNPKTAWAACPVILLSKARRRTPLEGLVGEGSNFLPSPIDPITLCKTHSLRWLAQIVCKIVRTVRWEFRSEGVASLADSVPW